MRWLLIFVFLGSAVGLPRKQREANYRALAQDVDETDMDLVFVSAMWRHGDRSPEHPIPGNPSTEKFTEDDWQLGGGGFGELTPLGMTMHFNLGRMIRDRYITNKTFISSNYQAKEIYIRSTDYNRTLISAYSNLAGMYTSYGVEGENYPTKADVPEWPEGYIPIPIHTYDYPTDHIGNPDSRCPRQNQLYQLIMDSPEYKAYASDPQVSYVLKYITEQSNYDTNIETLYDIQDPMFCETAHIDDLTGIPNSNMSDYYPWYFTGQIPYMVDDILDKQEDFQNGLGNPGGVNGIDVSVEIPKLRAGETIKYISGMIHGAIACNDNPDDTSCSPFYKKLKYFALSAHDTTVDAFLTLIGAKKYVIPSGYPNYSAALFIELFKTKNGEYFVKFLYHADPDSGFKAITAFVKGCDPTSNICPLSVFDDLVATYAHNGDFETLCNTPPEGVSPEPTSTTGAPNNINTESTTSTMSTPSTSQTEPTTTTDSTAGVSLASALLAILAAFIFSF